MTEPPPGFRARLRAIVLVVLVTGGAVVGVLTVGSGTVAAADDAGNVTSSHEIEASDPNARFDPGQSGTIDVYLTNNATLEEGDDNPPTSVRREAGEVQLEYVNITDTNVSGRDAAPVTVQTGRRPIPDGQLRDGNTSGPYPFDVQVAEDANPGTYVVNVTTTYEYYQNLTYTETSGVYSTTGHNRTTTTDTDTLTVEIQPQPDFEVLDTTPNVPLGGEGTLTVTLNNTGGENVTDATVSLTSQDSDLYFGSGTATTEANVGSWHASQAVSLEFRAGTVESAVKRAYPIDVAVDYSDSDGQTGSESTQFGVTPGKRDHFEVRGVDHDVPENGEGTLEITAANTWDRELDDVAITATTSATDLYLGTEGSRSASTIVEEWPAGGYLQRFTFRVGTTDASLDREYPIELQFEYTDAADNQNTQTRYVQFSPTDRGFFEVESVSHDVPRNGEGTLSVELEQTAEKDVEDVEVTASTADSAVYLGAEGSTSQTTMIGDWEDGDDETVTFRVGTTDAAVEQVYPLELSLSYTDEQDNENSRTKYVEFTPEDTSHLAVESVSHNVPRDGVGPVSARVKNTASKSLEDLTLTASSSDSEIYIGSESSRSGSATIEKLEAGDNRTVTYHVGATTNAVNRTYPLDLSIEYTDADNNDNQQTEQIEFRPRPEPRFVVESVDHDVPVGSTGRVAISLRNTGPVNATETVVTATSEADAMFFGTGGTEPVEVQGMTFEPPQSGTPTAQTFVGNWSTGETRTVYFRAGFDDEAIVREYVTNLAITYENRAGDEMPERTRSVGLEPLPAQNFSMRGLDSDLYVGEEGDLRVAVTNRADRPVTGVVLTAQAQGQHINFYNARYALAALDAGESAVADFRIGVTGEAEPGPRIFEVATRYRDPQGDIRETDSQDVLVDVEPSRDAFDLEVQTENFEPGESGPFEVSVRNQRNETLTDIQARLFTEDPLDSEDDSAFIESLGPGESETIVLDLSVGASASEKTYAASMDFRFDNARGDSELSDTQRVPVEVTKSDTTVGSLPLLGFGAVLVGFPLAAWRFAGTDRIETIYRDIRDR